MYCYECEYYREDRSTCTNPQTDSKRTDVGYLQKGCGHFIPKIQIPKPYNTMPETTKKCTQCGRELPLEQFKKNRYGFTSVCKDCARENYNKTQEGKVVAEAVGHSKNEPKPERGKPFTEEEIAIVLQILQDKELVAELRRRGYDVNCTKTISL